jgi:UDP-N-acetyl-D-glucosamine dehydrogenase
VACCPERLEVGDSAESARRMPRVVGAFSETAADAATAFYGRLGVPTTVVLSPEVAELSKLLENAFLTTGIGLMGEVTRIAHALGVSADEVARAASTKNRGYYPFRPGPGIGGHCLVNDLHLLQKTFEDAGLDSKLLAGVTHAAERLTPTVVAYLERCMASRGLAMRAAVICIIGVGFKPGSVDVTNTAASDVVRALRRKGAKVVYCDRAVDEFMVDGDNVERVNTSVGAIATLILSGDPSLNVADVCRSVDLVVDASGGRIMPGSQDRLLNL